MKTYQQICRFLLSKSSPSKAKEAMRFFKTGPGEYGEGDLFLGGISVPTLRELASKSLDLPTQDLIKLLRSKYHEERLLAVLIQVLNYSKLKDSHSQHKAVSFYLKHKSALNNWDLVDTSAYKILGLYCLTHSDYRIPKKLITSRHHWDRRLAMVSTLAWIRKGELTLTLQFAMKCFNDPEDLMHKACGWMLREAYKKDPKLLHGFITQQASQMPRTMLRYSIERMSPKERSQILRIGK